MRKNKIKQMMKDGKPVINGWCAIPSTASAEAMAHPQIGHRTPEVSVLIQGIVKGVKKVLYTDNRILLTSNPATALWEILEFRSLSSHTDSGPHTG